MSQRFVFLVVEGDAGAKEDDEGEDAEDSDEGEEDALNACHDEGEHEPFSFGHPDRAQDAKDGKNDGSESQTSVVEGHECRHHVGEFFCHWGRSCSGGRSDGAC